VSATTPVAQDVFDVLHSAYMWVSSDVRRAFIATELRTAKEMYTLTQVASLLYMTHEAGVVAMLQEHFFVFMSSSCKVMLVC
jgi:hypothetical protein